MEGPTPVSALIHAATMVAAGVFLMARIYFLFTTSALIVVGIVGSITAFWGAWCALREFDIKKILAYSTISQLGFMILGMSSGSYIGSMLHLFTHAFFKACLFLIAGAVIHYLHTIQHQSNVKFDEQDIRNMGGLRKELPNVFLSALLAGSSLMGLPFFSGFISKDVIFTQLFNSATQTNQVVSWIFLLVAFAISFLTVLYTFRFLWFIFFGDNPLMIQTTQPKAEGIPFILILPIAILSIASVWFIVGFNPFHFSGWLTSGLGGVAVSNFILPIVSAVWVLFALLIAYFVFRNNGLTDRPKSSFTLDSFYFAIIEKPVYQLASFTLVIDRKLLDRTLHFTAYISVATSHLLAWFDRMFIDKSVDGVARLAASVGSVTRSFSGGKIQSYILWAMTALIIFIIWILVY
jgi:NADH-quinone oxidoreductase subunit L